MSVEQLTPENVGAAIASSKAMGGFYYPHPVVGPVLSGSNEFKRLKSGLDVLHNPTKIKRFIDTNLGFMADKMHRVSDFTLEPLEIVSIWSCIEDAPQAARSPFSRLLIASYAVQGMGLIEGMETEVAPSWQPVPEFYMRDGEIPKFSQREDRALEHIKMRTENILDSLRDLTVYVYGTDIPDDMRERLTYGVTHQEEGAVAGLEVFTTREKERLVPTVAGVLREFAPEVSRFREAVFQPQLEFPRV